MAKGADARSQFFSKEIFISDAHHWCLSWIIHPTKRQSGMLPAAGWGVRGTVERPKCEIKGFGGKKCT